MKPQNGLEKEQHGPAISDVELPRGPGADRRIGLWPCSRSFSRSPRGFGIRDHVAGAWFFGMPGGLFDPWAFHVHPPFTPLSRLRGMILYAGVAGIPGRLSGHPGYRQEGRPRRRRWALPLLFAPPLFSRDVYSYAGQGEMASHHIDPYVYGTGRPRSTLQHMPDSVWTNTRPLRTTFSRSTVCSTRLRTQDPPGRLLRLSSSWRRPDRGRDTHLGPSTGTRSAQAVLLGAGCPLVLCTLIGGAHNEALMLGLLLADWRSLSDGHRAGLMLCAAAAGVKSPAALGVLFLGWIWAGPGASVRRRLVHTLGAGLIALTPWR